VQLAVDEINEKGGVGGYKIQTFPLDHSVNGKYNEQQGAQDMQAFVATLRSRHRGPVQLGRGEGPDPIGNDAGLLSAARPTPTRH
jgi:hypothetical protein